MAIENITLNIIPTGDTPSIHVAQFDVDRPFNVTLKEGEDDFIPTGYDIELQVRKVDSTIVTVVPLLTTGNVVTFNTTEQMTACSGTNLAELQLTKDSQTFATLHFYLVVQRDVLAGGVTSESDIYNLTEQIAAIVPEVIGDDYYNKEEVDEKIAEIPTFDPTNYYDKSDVNTLLNAKVNTSDLSAVAFSGDYNDLENKPDIPDVSNYYTKSEVDTKISDLYQIKNVSGNVVQIMDGGNDIPVKLLKSDVVPLETGTGGKSPTNPYIISGYSQGDIRVEDGNQQGITYTFEFGQTVYGGYFDNKGNLVVTHGIKTFTGASSESWSEYPSYNGFYIAITDMNVGTRQNGVTNFFITTFDSSHTSNACWFGVNSNRLFLIECSTITGATVEDLKTWLSNNNLVVVYPLATPISVTITEQKIPTLSGENNITSDTTSDTGDVEVDYFTDASDGIAELIKAFM